jgi:hypothetical protein
MCCALVDTDTWKRQKRTILNLKKQETNSMVSHCFVALITHHSMLTFLCLNRSRAPGHCSRCMKIEEKVDGTRINVREVHNCDNEKLNR